MPGSQAYADKTTHGKPREVARPHLKRADQCGSVFSQGLHVMAVAGILRLALAAMVVGDDPVLPFKGSPLGLKHRMIHQKPMRKYNSFRTSARLFVKQLYAVDFHARHLRSSVILRGYFSTPVRYRFSKQGRSPQPPWLEVLT